MNISVKILLLFLCLSCSVLKGKEDSLTIKNKAVYAEIGGVSGIASLNFEIEFLVKKNLKLGVKAGTGLFRVFDFEKNFNPDVLFQTLGFIRYGRLHNVEFNVGECLTSMVVFDGIKKRQVRFLSTFRLGYNFINVKRKFMVGCFYSPLVSHNGNYKHWACLTIGYIF